MAPKRARTAAASASSSSSSSQAPGAAPRLTLCGGVPHHASLVALWRDSGLDSVEAYDPQLGAWALVARMSEKRQLHALVVLDGKIYAVGGYEGCGAVLDTVEAYDPQANSWQRVASMPQGRCKHTAAAMGGKIYVTGGEDNQGSTLSSVFVYDSQANAWTQLASMGTARRAHASAAVGGKLYVFGAGPATVGVSARPRSTTLHRAAGRKGRASPPRVAFLRQSLLSAEAVGRTRVVLFATLPEADV
jgi:hypothetical protein